MSYIGSKRSSSLVSATEITLDGAKILWEFDHKKRWNYCCFE
jgi:hypothetical protein